MNIFPSFACNFQCKFCHIHKMNKGDLLDLDWLKSSLFIMPKIEKMTILGGEPSILPEDYLFRLIELCYMKTDKAPQMYTNLYKISPLVDDVELMVSYDPGSRQGRGRVLQNMLLLQKPFVVSTIITQAVVEAGVENLLKLAHKVKNIKQIHLSTYATFPDCEDLRPEPETFARFCEDFVRLNDGKLRFSPINALKNNTPKRASLVESMEILPDNCFSIAPKNGNELQKFKTFEEAALYYEREYNDIPSGCEACEYAGKCTCMYIDKDGDPDKMIAERIKEALD